MAVRDSRRGHSRALRARSQFRKRSLILCAAAAEAAIGLSANAATPLYWAPNGAAAEAGTFAWDTTTTDWATALAGTPSTAWSPGSIAYFSGGTQGSEFTGATVSGNQVADEISFNIGTVTLLGLSGSNPLLSIGADGIFVTGNSSNIGSMTIDATLPISLTSSQIWQASNNSQLNINGAAAPISTPSLTTTLDLYGSGNQFGKTSIVNGVLSDGTSGGQLAVVKTGAGPWNLGATNTYSGGTVIDGGLFAATATHNLGNGTVVLDAGDLRINSTVNFVGANYTSTSGFLIGPRAGISINTSNGGVVFGNLGDTTHQGAAVTVPIDPNSSGFIAIDASNTSYGTSINMLYIGNGAMFLGSTGGSSGLNGGSFTAAALTPGSGDIYRLGPGEGALRLVTNNLLKNTVSGTTNTSVIVGEPIYTVGGALGFGTVVLNQGSNAATNSYLGGTTVNLGSTVEVNGVIAAATGSPFGSASSGIQVNGGKILIDGTAGTATSTTVGDVSFTGMGGITVNTISPSTLATFTINGSNGLVRQNQGVLQVGTLGTSNALGTFSQVLVSTNAPATTPINGSAGSIVAPYFIDGSGNFLTYGSSGFVDATAGVATIAAAVASGNANEYVKTTAADSTATTTSIYDLNTGATLTAASANATLTISGGGLTVTGNIGSTAFANNVNLAFGGAEALIYDAGSSTIFGQITGSGGLTKSGAGQLTLDPRITTGTTATSNSFSGTITVNAGTLSAVSDIALGASGNGVLINGGAVNFGTSAFSTARTFTIGTNGAFFTGGSGGTTTFNGALTTGGGTTSAPFVDFSNGATTAVFVLADAANDFTAPIFLEGRSIVSVAADADLGNTANSITLNGTVTGNTQTNAPTLRFTGGFTTNRGITVSGIGANFDVTSTNAVVLAGAVGGGGSLIKIDTGILTFAATSTYSGLTTISAGTLTVDQSADGATGNLSKTVGVNIASGAHLHLLTNATDGLTGGQSVSLLNSKATLTVASGSPSQVVLELGGNIQTVQYFTIGTAIQPAGYYGSADFFTNNPTFADASAGNYDSYFSGDGGIAVSAPEPSSVGLLGVAGIVAMRRRRRASSQKPA